MKYLNERGCRVSISEIKDTIDILSNVDTSDPDIVFNVMLSTLGKDDVCRVALEDLRKQSGKSILFSSEKSEGYGIDEIPEHASVELTEREERSEEHEEDETWGWNW